MAPPSSRNSKKANRTAHFPQLAQPNSTRRNPAAAAKMLARGGLVAAFLLFSAGCQPKIGADCLQDQDCSQLGDRICDTTQPGGYCTQFNCDPTSCPEKESICIAFSNTPSTVAGCSNLGRTSPYARNFCARVCEENRDCREGYICVDLANDNPWGADVIQSEAESTKVCMYPQSGAEIPATSPEDGGRQNEVCQGAAGASGVGGAGGAAP